MWKEAFDLDALLTFGRRKRNILIFSFMLQIGEQNALMYGSGHSHETSSCYSIL